ncbi:hypothetical protein D3C71_2134550 [compost metagenome]
MVTHLQSLDQWQRRRFLLGDKVAFDGMIQVNMTVHFRLNRRQLIRANGGLIHINGAIVQP